LLINANIHNNFFFKNGHHPLQYFTFYTVGLESIETFIVLIFRTSKLSTNLFLEININIDLSSRITLYFIIEIKSYLKNVLGTILFLVNNY
jgi:hypothetical protein